MRAIDGEVAGSFETSNGTCSAAHGLYTWGVAMIASANFSHGTQAQSATSSVLGRGSTSVTYPAKTGQISFSTMPDTSTARYRNSGRSGTSGPTVSPSSSRIRRRAASSRDSPARGCPQQEFVQTPGQVFLLSARRVSSTSPRALKR